MKFIKRLIVPILLLMFCMQVIGQDTKSMLTKAKGLVMDEVYDEALTLYDEIFKLGTADSIQLGEGYGYAGICQEKLGNNSGATDYYTKALQNTVLELSIYDHAIAWFKEIKDNEKYEWALHEKVKYFPDFEVDVEKSLNTHYVRTKQYDQLLVSSDKMLKWFPESPKYYYNKGLALQSTGKINEASEAYKLALSKDEFYTSANIRLGHILFEKGNNIFVKEKKAYEAISKPSRLDYTDYHKALDKGKAVYKEALVYLENAYNKKQDANSKKMLHIIYTRLGDKEEALKYQ